MVCKRAGALSVRFVNVELRNGKNKDQSGDASFPTLNGNWECFGENFTATDEWSCHGFIIFLNFCLLDTM